MKIAKYMEDRLMVLNHELFPAEGEDVTLLIGSLISKRESLARIKKIVLEAA